MFPACLIRFFPCMHVAEVHLYLVLCFHHGLSVFIFAVRFPVVSQVIEAVPALFIALPQQLVCEGAEGPPEFCTISSSAPALLIGVKGEPCLEAVRRWGSMGSGSCPPQSCVYPFRPP